MNAQRKITSEHLRRQAYLYVRQSTLHQVHDHRESTARQYDLQRRAQALGWHADQIVVVDEDLGLSGASAVKRTGFQRLVSDVGLGLVGLVMGLEVSRLARSNADWHRLLEICALAGTLILDEDGVYDPSHFNDRLLLGLKGTMSEAELHMLHARLTGGMMNKARRGELQMRPPIGYAFDGNHHLAFDPDVHVQSAVRLLFETFQRTGSAGQVVKHFLENSLLWPRRMFGGPKAGDIVFAPLQLYHVIQALHNPRYAGAYVFGRTRSRRGPDGKHRYRTLGPDEWDVFLPNAHPAYISWEIYEANCARLRENYNAFTGDHRQSPPREGAALLQGILLCGRCGRCMTLRYRMCKGHPQADYTCLREKIQTGKNPCQIIVGWDIDDAVGRVVIEAVKPSTLDVALEVYEELRARKLEVDRLRRIQVERAREEADLAKRQFMLVRPENRLVADTLERAWNEKLLELAHEEEEYTRAAVKADDALSGPDAGERIKNLASDLPRVWNDPRTPARDRKRILRLLIEDVTLLRIDTIVKIHIRWKGGATTSIERAAPRRRWEVVQTSPAIVERIRSLAMEQTDHEIARTLDAEQLRSGTGRTFNVAIVRGIRAHYDIPSQREFLQSRGWLTVPETAKRISVSEGTVRQFAQEGLLHAVRTSSRGDILFAPLDGFFPKKQQGKKLRDRSVFPKLPQLMRKKVQYEM
jgi:DNA invertase Pin-like site-specific DNA recombinase